MDWTLIGVDPAPSKKTTLWSKDECHSIAPPSLRAEIDSRATGNVLLAWDAPLSFDAKYGFSDRPIDRAVRKLIAELIAEQKSRIEPKAVAALPFAGCPHWAITCTVLGRPFGDGGKAWQLPSGLPTTEGRAVFEVNPAVAWAFWWIRENIDGPMPRYKKGSEDGLRTLIARLGEPLGIPELARKDDDTLDAWAAWKLLDDLIREKAQVVGLPSEGAYLLPSVSSLIERVGSLLEKARNELEKSARGRSR